jgi:heterodisulfide reductase subunit A
VCCGHAIKNALKLKKINPAMNVYILFRDIRTYGFSEDYYRLAAENDVKFIRYEPDAKPQVAPAVEEGRPVLRVTVPDYILGQKLALDADLVVLSAAIVPGADNRNLSQQFKVTLGPDDFFKEAHVKLRPVEFGTEGVYLCGLAHYPKHIPESINQAYGAASRALTLLSHDTVTVSGSVCEVEETKCMSCGACIDACTYNAIEFRSTKQGQKAVVNPVLCKGDGLCNAKCPTGAIYLKHFTDEDLVSQIDAAAS